MGKAGMVVQIRVNPKDCLAILDIMHACNIDPYDGRSFAQCVSIALSSMIGMTRRASIIAEEEDGFQFLNRMGPFLNSKNDKRKHRYDDALYKRAEHGLTAPDLSYRPAEPGPYLPEHIKKEQAVAQPVGWTEHGPTTSAAQQLPLDEETKLMLAEELGTLYTKENSGETLTPEEQERYHYLNRVLYP